MNRNHDIIAIASQGFVNRVINDLKHQMMQTGAIRSITDIHPWTFSYRLKPLQNLYRAGSIIARLLFLFGAWFYLVLR
jgi:hypothetical protein